MCKVLRVKTYVKRREFSVQELLAGTTNRCVTFTYSQTLDEIESRGQGQGFLSPTVDMNN